MTGSTAQGIGAWLLVGVFAVSGLAKLRRPEPAALAMVHFGVTRRFRPLLGTALGGLEVALAVALALDGRQPAALGVTATLLILFSAVVGRALSAGRRFACACFGGADAPLSAWTLGRTALLALVAVGLLAGAVWAGRPPAAGGLRVEVLEASAAAAVLAVTVLATKAPKLLRWNATP